MPAVYDGTYEQFETWEPQRLLDIGITLKPDTVSREADPYSAMHEFLGSVRDKLTRASGKIRDSHGGAAGDGARAELKRLDDLANGAQQQTQDARTALSDHAGQVAAAKSELDWYREGAAYITPAAAGIAAPVVDDVAAWAVRDDVEQYQNNSNLNYADRYPGYDPPTPSPVQPTGFDPRVDRPGTPGTPGTGGNGLVTPPAATQIPDVPVNPTSATPPPIPVQPPIGTHTLPTTPPPPPITPPGTTRPGALDPRYRPTGPDTNRYRTNQPNPFAPTTRTNPPTSSYRPSTRAGGPTGQPPLSSRPGGATSPARPTIGSAGTAGPGGTANRGPLGAGGVPHGGGAPHGSNSDDKHTRAPWLLEDDPDAIWFAGLPSYTDPVISAERGHR